MKKINIAVIFGGKSQEHEVSLVSASHTIEALQKDKKYQIIPIGITKQGAWYVGKNILNLFKNGLTEGLSPVVIGLDNTQRIFITKGGGRIEKKKIDVAFPLVSGPHGEDGALPGLLEMAGIPYVGDGIFASSCCFDKVKTKALLSSADISQVKYESFDKDAWLKQRSLIEKKIVQKISFPCFVKPARCGSSIGVAKVKKSSELVSAVKSALLYDNTIIVEAAVPNVIEVECSLLGNDQVVVSIPGEIHFDGEFYDYNAKYISKKWDISIPPNLPKKITEEVRLMAVRAFKAINCSGFARIDFLINSKSGEIYLNEINTVPSFRPEGVFVRLMKTVGYDFKKVITTLLNLAILRHKNENKLVMGFKPEQEWYKKA